MLSVGSVPEMQRQMTWDECNILGYRKVGLWSTQVFFFEKKKRNAKHQKFEEYKIFSMCNSDYNYTKSLYFVTNNVKELKNQRNHTKIILLEKAFIIFP